MSAQPITLKEDPACLLTTSGSSSRRCKSRVCGLDYLRCPDLYRGSAFTIYERQCLGIHGLIPPVVLTMEQQLEQIVNEFNYSTDNFTKFKELITLHRMNLQLFFRFIRDYLPTVLPVLRMPVNWTNLGLITRYVRGLYISVLDHGHVADVLRNWPEQQVRVIVVTDGGVVPACGNLSGDLGVYGISFAVTTLVLYTALAGVHPSYCLPVQLDLGTDRTELLADPLYSGSRTPRIRGPVFESFLQEFMRAVTYRYGQNCFVHFLNFSYPDMFRLFEENVRQFCAFNGDYFPAAAVVIACIISSLKFTGKTKVSEYNVLIVGAGHIGLAIADLLLLLMQDEDLTKKQAMSRIWMMDKKGLLALNKQSQMFTAKLKYARDIPPIESLLKVVKSARPNVLVGCTGVGPLFTRPVLRVLSQQCARPIVIALSRPEKFSECTAAEVYQETEFRAVFAGGNVPNPYLVKNQIDLQPSHCDNLYIYPGFGLGAVCAGVIEVTPLMHVRAAQALAGLVGDQEVTVGALLPKDPRVAPLEVAVAVAQCAYETGKATVLPRPSDVRAFISSQMYNCSQYGPALPLSYPWRNPAAD